MQTEVARLDLHNRRRSTLGYAAAAAFYMLVIVALYPTFKHSTGLDKLISDNPTISAMFGAVGSLTTPAGWLDANAYTNLLPLIMLLLTIGYGASAIAGQDEDGTLRLVAVLPLSRRAIVIQKAGAMLAQALALTVTVAVCVYVGRAFGVTLNAWHVATATLALFALGIDFGLIALALGAATHSRGTAIGVTAGLAAASYLLSSLAPVVHLIRPLRFASLFYWADDNRQLAQGASAASFAVLVGLGLITAVAANAAFARFDVQ